MELDRILRMIHTYCKDISLGDALSLASDIMESVHYPNPELAMTPSFPEDLVRASLWARENLVARDVWDHKIKSIKRVREQHPINLKEAKTIVDTLSTWYES